MVLINLGLLFYKNILRIKIKIYKQSNNFNLHKKKVQMDPRPYHFEFRKPRHSNPTL